MHLRVTERRFREYVVLFKIGLTKHTFGGSVLNDDAIESLLYQFANNTFRADFGDQVIKPRCPYSNEEGVVSIHGGKDGLDDRCIPPMGGMCSVQWIERPRGGNFTIVYKMNTIQLVRQE